jgi:hypothetical protein
MPASDCLLRLRELALEMQNHEQGRQKQVTLAWAGEKLARRFANREAAERFLRAEQADSGIVVSRGKEIAYWLALRRAGVPAELHIYERGRHGVGLAPTDLVLSSWPRRLADWLYSRGLLVTPRQ